MKNILIFGGLGFIGSNIIDELRKDDEYNTIVFDFPGIINSFGTKIKMIYGDFNNEEDVEAVFRQNKIDIVIHLISTTIPASSNNNIIYDIEANLITTVRLLHLLVKYEIPEIVFISSGGTVYGTTESELINESHPTYPISSHGVIKLTIEKYIYLFHQLTGLNYLILRVGNPYGPYQKSTKQGVINVFLRNMIYNEKLIVRGDGNAIRDYFFVKDLALIIKRLIAKNVKNEIINIGSGQGVSVNEIIDILININRNINIEYTHPLNSDVNRIVLNIDKLRTLLNIDFCSLNEGIMKTYNYMLNDMLL